jgi:hypothetical protein
LDGLNRNLRIGASHHVFEDIFGDLRVDFIHLLE